MEKVRKCDGNLKDPRTNTGSLDLADDGAFLISWDNHDLFFFGSTNFDKIVIIRGPMSARWLKGRSPCTALDFVNAKKVLIDIPIPSTCVYGESLEIDTYPDQIHQ